MTQRQADFFDRKYNAYVPACTFATYEGDKGNGIIEVDFGRPVAAVAAAFLSGQSIATAGNNVDLGITLLRTDTPDRFGRVLTVVADGASTATVTVDGRDYLGQPMRETLTLNGTTPVPGVKAFKWIDRISWGATAGRAINVGFGAVLGLPLRCSNVMFETANSIAAAAGTLTAADLTDPQTATTGDPRGRYTPTTTLNGTNRINATFAVDGFVNGNGNGGLYGIRHYPPQ